MNKVARVMIFFGGSLLLSGCWDQKEIEERAFVFGITLDVAENRSAQSANVELTQQLVVPENLMSTGSGGGGGSGPAYRNLFQDGKTVFDVSREIVRQTSRELDVTQLEVVLFSEEIAKEPKLFKQLVDVFLREKDMRRSIKLAIASGKAKELLSVEAEHEKIPVEYITKELEGRGKLEILDIVRVGDIQEKLLTKESFPLPQLKMKDSKVIEYEGIAVYNGHLERMVGTLKGEEAKGASFIRGQKYTGAVNVELEQETAAMEVLEIKSNLSLEDKEPGNLRFTLEIDINGIIAEQYGTENIMNEKVHREFEDALRKKVEKMVRKTLDTLQNDLQTDVLGFGVYMYHFHPELWELVKKDWDSGENHFSQSEVDIRVNITVERPGNINRTAQDEGGQ